MGMPIALEASVGEDCATGSSSSASIVGTEGSKADIANKLLDYLNKQSSKGNALSPEQAKEYAGKVFTDISGNTLPVDIGAITNNPTLSKLFDYLKNVPLSEATSKANQLSSQLAEKDINALEHLYQH